MYLVGLSEKHPKCPKSRRFQHPVVKQRFEQVSQQTESDKMHMTLHPPSELMVWFCLPEAVLYN